MKRLITLIMITFLVSVSLAEKPPATAKQLNMKRAEASLLMGLNSGNEGLEISSAYRLGEIKSGKSVIPLMEMLRSDKNEEARIMAALSLIKIGSDKSTFAVKQAARFDKSKRVRKQCAQFYAEYKANN